MASTAHVLMWLGAFVTYTLLICPKLTQYETHKHYIAGSLKPWSPSASWVRGFSMGGPIVLWTKDYNGFCEVSYSPLQRLSWLKVTRTTDLYQIDTKQRRSRPSDRKSRAPGADRPRPQREFARAPLAASNSTDTTAFATGYIACTVHMSLNIALQTTWLCT